MKSITTLYITYIFVFLLLSSGACTHNDDEKTWTEPSGQCRYSAQATEFSFWAPTASQVELKIYQTYDGEPIRTESMQKTDGGWWLFSADGDLKNHYYTFRVNAAGKWWKEIPGMYATAVGVNGNRAAIIDWNDTHPAGWTSDVRPPQTNPADVVIYELHYRDFSVHPSSGIHNKGKYLSLTETGTRSPEGLVTGTDHLRELGITHVQLLPSTDFGSIDETTLALNVYNWGYEPQNYNVPEGSYTTDPYNPITRIKEFKTAIQALHKAGIRVVLDVVYNHTTNVLNCSFENTVPGYFYRMRPDGSFADASACGNETASEKEMMRRFMIESLAFWVEEYHIDGFRFDLMAIHDIETMNEIRNRLTTIEPTILLYGEGWAASAPSYPEQKLAFKKYTSQMPGIGAFSDDFRDALRGSLDGSRGGFISGTTGSEEAVKFGIVGGIPHPQIKHSSPWAAQPTQHISYVTCHDDHCLRDRITIIAPQADEEQQLRMNKLAQTAVFTSQGIPFIFCGEELFHTKQGVGNSYNSPDEINQIDWQNKSTYNDLFSYYKNLIALRRLHPGLWLGSAEAVRKHMEFLVTEANLVAFRIKDLEGIDSARSLVVVLNGNPTSRTVEIPEGEYTIFASDGVINSDGLGKINGKSVEVAGTSAMFLGEY